MKQRKKKRVALVYCSGGKRAKEIIDKTTIEGNCSSAMMPRCSNHDKAAVARGVCEVSCIACRLCEKNCPADAIQVIDNCALIDEDLCISCGMCAVKCPRGTIVDRDGIFS